MADADSSGQARVHVIGDVEVSHEGTVAKLQTGQRQLLALLVAVGPNGASPEKLADEIWGERLPGNWPNSLRVAIHRLRKRADLPVVSEGGRYRLGLEREAVDAWRLQHLIEAKTPWHSAMASLLSSPTCFPSVEPSPSILEATSAIAIWQRQLIELLATTDTIHDRPFLGQLAAHVTEDPTDDRLVHAIATILATNGSAGEALALIERCRNALLRVFDSGLPAPLEELATTIRERTAPSEPVEAASLIEPRRQLPLQLQRYRRDDLVGRDGLLDEFQRRLGQGGAPTVAIHGPSGVGKTAVLAELAHRISGDTHVLYVAGAETNTIGLSPLLTSVPGFASHVDRERADGAEPEGRRGRLAQGLIELIAAQASNRPTLLLIDDVQWLDSQTCELLDYMLRAEAGRSLAGVVTAKRSDSDETVPSRSLESALDRLTDVSTMEVHPLTADDVEQVLGRLEPDLSFTARHQKAQWLHDASAGLPEVVRRMIEIGDTTPADATDTFRVFDRVIASLDRRVRTVGVAAAVRGRRFRLSDVAELLTETENKLADLVEVLIERDLVLEAGSFDHFEFRHQLIVDGFLRSSSTAKLARLHLQACSSSVDVHALSRHRVASGSLSEPEVTLDAVLASAEQYLLNRQFWESVSEFRTAIGIEGVELGPQAYINYARAVSLAGSPSASRAVRERAYTVAVSAKAWDLAIDAARSGLPEAETPDGEADRLAQLEDVSPQELSPSRRLAQALTASRLASQLGHVERATRWAERAAASADSDDERGEAALCRRFVQMVDRPPAERLDHLNRAIDGLQLPAALRCRASQFRAVDELEIGAYECSVEEHQRFLALATSTDDHLRHWHALVFGALLAELKGDFATADELADAGQELGRRHAITQAEIVRVAQRFFRLEACGQLDSLVDLIGLIPVTDADSTLFSAATTRVLLAAGRHEEAGDLAVDLAHELLARPTVTSHGSMALLAPALAGRCSDELRRGALASLEPFRGGGMVIGVGLGFVPSIDHLWMLLSDSSGAGQLNALRQAIADCDSSGCTTWSIRYRLDLAARSGSAEARAEAERLAAGTDLAPLFTTDPIAV